MGRRAATIEYLERLVNWAGGRKALCDKTGIQQSNLSDYLQGKKPIRWNRLQSATQDVFGEPPAFHPIVEGYDLMAKGYPNVSELPREGGLYALFDSSMRAIYYGKAKSLYTEVRQTLNRRVAEVRPLTGSKKHTFWDITTYLSAYTIRRGDADFRHDIEALGLRLIRNNTFNKNSGSFKRKN